ncbi:MAG: hypothetical protein LBV33_03750 [Lachnospiraceae bacterium]|nr:hypothetical protein [Lachnospiraceae bacterium]
MNEYTLKKIKGLLAAILFLVCLGTIVIGHRTVSLGGLLQMLIGLAGLLVLFYLYNRSYTRKE